MTVDRLLKLGAIAALVALVSLALPDVKRYLEMRRM
jgi:hypothetical protein